MPSTYLELCQQLVEDAGISGEIVSVDNQTGELKRVVDWVARATTAVEGMWFNWDFLHVFHTFTTTIGVQDYPAPADFNLWDVSTGSIPAQAQNLDYIQWTKKKRDPTAAVSGSPYMFTVLPDKALRLYDTPTTTQTIAIEYWKTPTTLSGNTSEPSIPAQFRDIIVAKALQYYANYESADEAKIQAAEEFGLRLNQLQASELPAHQASSAINTGVDIQIQVPFDSGDGGGGFDY